MKNGVLMGVKSLEEADSLALDFTKRFQPPNNTVFKAKALPADSPIHLARYDFSESRLQQSSVEVNTDLLIQFLKDMKDRTLGDIKIQKEPRQGASFSFRSPTRIFCGI